MNIEDMSRAELEEEADALTAQNEENRQRYTLLAAELVRRGAWYLNGCEAVLAKRWHRT